MKVTLEAVNSANVKVTNAANVERVFNVSANMGVSGKVVNNFEDGRVLSGEDVKATFQRWNAGGINIQFMTTDKEEMCALVGVINEFIADCEEAVEKELLNI